MEESNPDPVKSWPDFVQELQRNILPLYRVHEATFDYGQIHGQMHICRAVLFAEVIARAYAAAGAALDFYGLRTATAFHDSGREGSGHDYWESESEINCANYLIGQPAYARRPAAAKRAAHWISKAGRGDLNHFIVFDADVLEIMRPGCGHGGLTGFHRSNLHFMGSKDTWAGKCSDPPV